VTTSPYDSVSSSTVSEPAAGSPGRSVSPVGDEPALRDWADELVERARSEGVELTGDNGLLTALVRQVFQTGLEVEMTDHVATNITPSKVAGRTTAATVATQDGHWSARAFVESGSWNVMLLS
jgi:hypothetical protein